MGLKDTLVDATDLEMMLDSFVLVCMLRSLCILLEL